MRKLISLTAVLFLFASNASAFWSNAAWLTQYKKPNIHWGQLAIHPYYEFTEVYDSNIYLVPRDQPNGVVVGGGHRESWITKNALGVEFNLPWHALHNLSFGYGFESQIYTTQPSINNAFNQTAHADYQYKGAYGLTLNAGDNYVNTTDQAFSELVGRNRRWMNDAHASMDYNPENGRLAGGVDAHQENDKYISPDLAQVLNRYEQSAGFNIGYKVQPQTKVYISYHRGIIHYSVPEPAPNGMDKDSRSNSYGLGVSGKLAAKVEGQVEAGLTNRKYDVAAPGSTRRVYNSPTVATRVTYKADDYTTVILGLSRYYEESIDPSNPLYTANLASIDISHKLPYKFKVGVRGSYGVNKYDNSQVLDPTSASTARGNRRDDIYHGEGWVTYDIQQWLSTGLGYTYTQRNSTLTSQFNYDDNQVAWNLELKF